MTIVRHDTNARMSQAVVHGDTVYLAGQVSDTAKDVAGQTADVLKQIDALLAKCGTAKDRMAFGGDFKNMLYDRDETGAQVLRAVDGKVVPTRGRKGR